MSEMVEPVPIRKGTHLFWRVLQVLLIGSLFFLGFSASALALQAESELMVLFGLILGAVMVATLVCLGAGAFKRIYRK